MVLTLHESASCCCRSDIPPGWPHRSAVSVVDTAARFGSTILLFLRLPLSAELAACPVSSGPNSLSGSADASHANSRAVPHRLAHISRRPLPEALPLQGASRVSL